MSLFLYAYTRLEWCYGIWYFSNREDIIHNYLYIGHKLLGTVNMQILSLFLPSHHIDQSLNVNVHYVVEHIIEKFKYV